MTKASFSSTNSERSTVTVELIGTLKHRAGKGKLMVGTPRPVEVATFIRELEEHGIPKQTFLVEGSEEIRSDLLILVNGREIGALNGLATILSGGDCITLLPVSHGG